MSIKYQISTTQVSSKIADETVILNHQKGVYYGLNEVGTFIWDYIKTQPSTFEEIQDAVLSAYDVNESTLQKDINVILKDLINEKLVEIIEKP